ncbi:MAG: hypothetical protein ABIH34_04845 [Nanoarchaeota archaeon]
MADKQPTQDSQNRFLFPPELIAALEALVKSDIKEDPALACLACGASNLKFPLYHRDLGGPYCDNDSCIEMAELNAFYDSFPK